MKSAKNGFKPGTVIRGKLLDAAQTLRIVPLFFFFADGAENASKGEGGFGNHASRFRR